MEAGAVLIMISSPAAGVAVELAVLPYLASASAAAAAGAASKPVSTSR